jgi:hypothetical protein
VKRLLLSCLVVDLLLVLVFFFELLHELDDFYGGLQNLANVLQGKELHHSLVSEEVQLEDICDHAQLDVLDQMNLHVVVEEFDQDAMDLAERGPPALVVADLGKIHQIDEDGLELCLLVVPLDD